MPIPLYKIISYEHRIHKGKLAGSIQRTESIIFSKLEGERELEKAQDFIVNSWLNQTSSYKKHHRFEIKRISLSKDTIYKTGLLDKLGAGYPKSVYSNISNVNKRLALNKEMLLNFPEYWEDFCL